MLQRVRIPGGRLTGPQWRALAEIARRFTPETPLHLTTRQDIEIHDLRPQQVPAVQQALAEAGLSTLGAAGDAVRNIVVCPCCGTGASAPDLMPLARALREAMEAGDLAFGLPRKFKVSLSCGPTCGQPFIQDVGLVLARRDSAWGFRVIAGGSLGASPATGVEVLDWLELSKAPAMVRAALAVFAAHGDRTNRARARLRHVRQRIGDDAFRKLLLDELARTGTPPFTQPLEGQDLPARVELVFDDGDVSPQQACALAELCERPGVAVRITTDHSVLLAARADAALADARRIAPPARFSVVACPGTRWCKRGLVDAPAAAKRLRAELASKGFTGACIRISGCPNGCAQSAVAPVGLTGSRATIDGRQCETFDLWLGGEMGRSSVLGAREAQRLTLERAADAISRQASHRP
jgi:sulfite reductase beta subunit-like hemoprotein